MQAVRGTIALFSLVIILTLSVFPSQLHARGGSTPPDTSGNANPNNGQNGGETCDPPAGSLVGGTEETTKDTVHTDGDPILLAMGELVLTEVDLRIPGRGFDFVMQRTYRSQYNFDGILGYNWNFLYNERLILPNASDADQNIKHSSGASRIDIYRSNPDGSFTSPNGKYDELRLNPDGTYTMRDRHGFKKHFNADGKLLSYVDRHGNTMTFHYDDQDRLSIVTDTLGRDITFIYTPVGRLETVRDFIGREVNYFYDPQTNDLVIVHSPIVTGTSTGNDFPEGKTTRYRYTSGFDEEADPRLAALNHNLVRITDPKGQHYLANTYGTDPDSYEFDRVLTQREGESDQVYHFSYTELNPGGSRVPDLPRNQTILTDRNGNIRVFIHNGLGNLLTESIQTNRNVNANDPDEFVTTHTYNIHSERLSITFPEGNRIEYTYDDTNPDPLQQGNLLAITHLPGPRGGDQNQRQVTRSYEPIYNQIRAQTEPRGNDPSFVPQNGGQANPERYTTRYTFDYQEGNNLAALAAEIGRGTGDVSALLADAGMSLNLGDRNGDGLTDQINGNVVQRDDPSVNLLANSRQATIEGDTTQEIIRTYTYNRFGQRTSETDPEGNVDRYLYYPESDPDGDGLTSESSLVLAHDTGGYRSAVIFDSAVNQIRNGWFYDPVGNVIRTIDGQGNPTTYEVNALNQVVRKILEPPFHYEHHYFYDANNNIIREEIQNVDTNGPNLDDFVTYTYDYDILDNRITKTEEMSAGEVLVTSYAYDRNENLVRITQPEGNVMERVYDERDLVFSLTRGAGSPEASTQTMTYDGNQNLIRVVDAADNNGDGAPEETLIFYDGYDRRVSTMDAVGNVMTYTYDPASNMIREQHLGPNGGPSPTTNAGNDNVLLAEQEMRFDELSRKFEQNDLLFSNIAPVGPEGPLTPGDGMVTMRYEYDRNSRRTRVLDDNIHHRIFEYDGVDRVIREIDELDNEIFHTYDDNHNVIATVEVDRSPEGIVPDESFVTLRKYDAIDRLTVLIDNLGNATTHTYDSRNNRIRTEDQLGNTTTYIYDGINRKLAEIVDLREGGMGSGAIDTGNPANPDGQITEAYDWDGNSRLASTTDDNGNVTTYEYDALDRRITERFADETTNIYLYDGDDNVLTFTDENGSVHSNEYDGINRLIAKDVARAAGVEGTTEWRFEYDGLSRMTQATDDNDPVLSEDNSILEFQYDSLSRRLVELQNGRRIETEFDGVGNRLSCTYPNGRVIETTYDGLDRINTIWNQGNAIIIAAYNYVGPTRVLERLYGNGTRLLYHNDADQDIGYDGARRRVLHRHEDVDGELVAGFRHAFDREDNRRYEVNLFTRLADVFEYDSAYRVTRAGERVPADAVAGITNNDTVNADVVGLTGNTETTYTFDGVGNWVQRANNSAMTTFVPNEMNEYSAIGDVVQTHDDNGNLTDDGSRQYVYDFANRLIRVLDHNEADIARYTYDALDRRISKVTGNTTTFFFYDGDHSIEERDGNDVTVRQYVFGQRTDEALELQTGGETYFYHDNWLGSIAALTNESGAVVERYRYDAYGQTTVLAPNGTTTRPDSMLGNPFRYTARRFDAETGFYYYRARYYDPDRGRFLQRDPKGYVDGMGLYTYVSNNPINFTDAFGTEKEPATGAGRPPGNPGDPHGHPGDPHGKHEATGSRGRSGTRGGGGGGGGDGFLKIFGKELFRQVSDTVYEGFREDTFGGFGLLPPTGNKAAEYTAAAVGLFTPGGAAKKGFQKGGQKLFQSGGKALQKKTKKVTREDRWKQLAKEGKLSKQETEHILRHGGKGMQEKFGKELAHRPGRPTARGHDYSEAIPKTSADHRGIQHRYLRESRKGTRISRPKKSRSGGKLDLPREGVLP